MMEALAERDQLTPIQDVHRELAKRPTAKQERYRKLEIKFMPAAVRCQFQP